MDERIIAFVAERNHNVRELLSIKALADKHNLKNERLETNLASWVSDWLASNPLQAALIRGRVA